VARQAAAKPVPASTRAARTRLVRQIAKAEAALVKLTADLARDLVPEGA
jgi:hypothetical protein